MWIRELATGWERVYKPSEHASASVTRGTRDAVPTVAFNDTGKGAIATFDDGTVVPGSLVIGADGPRSKVREFAMSSTEKASVKRFPIFHTNMTVCFGDVEKARFVRQRFPTSYLALSQRSFHAFQSSKCSMDRDPSPMYLY
jgi:2-polyprenyl-6-methoxyphenol hydroxylase-like FAD-dependent oxidoreductase